MTAAANAMCGSRGSAGDRQPRPRGTRRSGGVTTSRSTGDDTDVRRIIGEVTVVHVTAARLPDDVLGLADDPEAGTSP